MTTPADPASVSNDPSSAPSSDALTDVAQSEPPADLPEGRVSDATPEGAIPDATPEGSDPESHPEGDNANTEAAKYRRRLRDTETQLSTTSERLATYQRRHAELALGEVLTNPADLFDVGQADLADFVDDDGEIRTDDLIAAAAALVEQRPQLGANYTPPWPADVDFGQGVRSQSVSASPSWAAALDPIHHSRQHRV